MRSITGVQSGAGSVCHNTLESVCNINRWMTTEYVAAMLKTVNRHEKWVAKFGLAKSIGKLIKDVSKLGTYGIAEIKGVVIVPGAAFPRYAMLFEHISAFLEYTAIIMGVSGKKQLAKNIKVIQESNNKHPSEPYTQKNCELLTKYLSEQKNKKLIAKALFFVQVLNVMQFFIESGITIPAKDTPVLELARELTELLGQYNVKASLYFQLPISFIPALISAITLYDTLCDDEDGNKSEKSDSQSKSVVSARDRIKKMIKIMQKIFGLAQHSFQLSASGLALAGGNKTLAKLFAGEHGDDGFEEVVEILMIISIGFSMGYSALSIMLYSLGLNSYRASKNKKGTEKKQIDIQESGLSHATGEAGSDTEDRPQSAEKVSLLSVTSETDSNKKQKLAYNGESVVFDEMSRFDQNNSQSDMDNTKKGANEKKESEMVTLPKPKGNYGWPGASVLAGTRINKESNV